jgi:sugar (pentulose or hexulose) kinase
MLRFSEALMPRPEQVEKYEKNYRLYRSLYPALKGQFGILSN